MYVAVKVGERAIDNAHAWLAAERRGDPTVAELTVPQIREQLRLAVNRVIAEGSYFDPDLAGLAIKQSRGDLIEAVFLIRADRTTLPQPMPHLSGLLGHEGLIRPEPASDAAPPDLT